MKRQQFSTSFKSKVALEAIKGHRTVNEIASEFEVHPTQVNAWKKQALEGLGGVFKVKAVQADKAALKEKDKLYQKVGQLQIEVDWLKKKMGILD